MQRLEQLSEEEEIRGSPFLIHQGRNRGSPFGENRGNSFSVRPGRKLGRSFERAGDVLAHSSILAALAPIPLFFPALSSHSWSPN
jgi:hypothetical protein